MAWQNHVSYPSFVKMFLPIIYLTLCLGLDVSDRKYIKCLVCKRIAEEITKELKISGYSSSSVNQKGFVNEALSPNKPSKDKTKSELYLIEMMEERLCKRIDEYVRAYNRTTGQLELIPLMIDGKMNEFLGAYKIIEDGDLESIEFYCQSVLSEFEEEMFEIQESGFRDIESKLCFNTKLCVSDEDVDNMPTPSDEL